MKTMKDTATIVRTRYPSLFKKNIPIRSVYPQIVIPVSADPSASQFTNNRPHPCPPNTKVAAKYKKSVESDGIKLFRMPPIHGIQASKKNGGH